MKKTQGQKMYIYYLVYYNMIQTFEKKIVN